MYKHPVISSGTIRKVIQLLESGELSGYRGSKDGGGYCVTQLEDEFKKFFNVKHAIALNSATSGLFLALRALELHGRVAVSPLTFSASASCILLNNLDPVFVDVEEDYFNLNPGLIPDDVAAVVAVHLQGHPCDMDSMPDVPIIEDVAQAIGSIYKGSYSGTIGTCGVFSFNQHKQVSTGEGGMLITDDDTLAEKIRWLYNHGECRGGLPGFNMRMNEIEALLALDQFKNLNFNLEWRTSLATHLTNLLEDYDIITPKIHEECVHSFYTYTLKTKYRDELQRRLFSTSFYFGNGGGYTPCHHLPAYKPYASYLPVTEKLTQVMMFTDRLRYPMTKNEVGQMAEVIMEFLDEHRESG